MDELYKYTTKDKDELTIRYSNLGSIGKFIAIGIYNHHEKKSAEFRLSARELDDLMYELKFARRKLEE